MKQVVCILLVYIQIQYYIICYLLTLLIGKDFMPKDKKPINKRYHQLQVDDLPIINPCSVRDCLKMALYKQSAFFYDFYGTESYLNNT